MTASYEHAVVEHVIDLLEDGDQLVALIEMVPEPGCLLVENVAVHPAHQGKGLGDVLMTHAEASARSLGLGTVRLYTNARFGSNLAFYARRGYVEDRREAIAAGGELVHLVKTLPRVE